MIDEGIIVFGIPIPSSSPVLLSILAVHVVAGIACTIVGIVAMIAPKRSGRHPSAGTTLGYDDASRLTSIDYHPYRYESVWDRPAGPDTAQEPAGQAGLSGL